MTGKMKFLASLAALAVLILAPVAFAGEGTTEPKGKPPVVTLGSPDGDFKLEDLSASGGCAAVYCNGAFSGTYACGQTLGDIIEGAQIICGMV
jgi:hypothetical protein